MARSLFKNSFAVVAFFLLVMRSGTAVASAESCALLQGEELRQLQWNGLHRVKQVVVERENRAVVGSVLRCEALEQTAKRLEGLDLFAEVRYTVLKTEGGVAVEWHLRELPPWLPLPSAKISDQDGWLLGPSVIGLNLLGQNIRLEAHARFTTYPEWFRAQEYTFSLSSPWLGNWPIEYDLRLIRTDSWNPLKLYNEKSWEWGGEFAKRFGSHWLLLFWGDGLNVEPNELEGGWSFSTAEGENAVVAGGGVRWDRRDRALDTRSGEWAEWRGGWGGTPRESVGSWFESVADLRLWRSWRERLIFHGSILARWRPGEVPFPLYYHQGGINSLRGHSPDANRFSRDELLSTVELRYSLLERVPVNIGGVHFFLALQAVAGVDGARLGFQENDRGMVGYFAGLHLLLPGLDRLRLEGGWSKEEGFSFALGLYEKTISQRWRGR